jgi:hypothetical protein
MQNVMSIPLRERTVVKPQNNDVNLTNLYKLHSLTVLEIHFGFVTIQVTLHSLAGFDTHLFSNLEIIRIVMT